ncbi:MAG TPA: MerR family transcriptional regulator [Treponemataceae bacterium]|nr:MerR family transcriptional regulator [Treponemataceae bacterium]
MASFLIGEVEAITGIKAHVLRYWETIIPSLSPPKDMGRRRSYSNKDVQVILRLKYLIQEKKYTIEGARDRLIEDLAFPSSDLGTKAAEISATIQEIRGTLLEILSVLQQTKN